jgi:hypothetical protein
VLNVPQEKLIFADHELFVAELQQAEPNGGEAVNGPLLPRTAALLSRAQVSGGSLKPKSKGQVGLISAPANDRVWTMTYARATRVSAVTLSAAAAWLAFAGVDLGARSEGGWLDAGHAALQTLGSNAAPIVNRAEKADRDTLPQASSQAGTTLSFQLMGQDSTSVVMRLPMTTTAKSGTGAGRPSESGVRRMMVACEPTVSPLAAAGKSAEPGRCVT